MPKPAKRAAAKSSSIFLVDGFHPLRGLKLSSYAILGFAGCTPGFTLTCTTRTFARLATRHRLICYLETIIDNRKSLAQLVLRDAHDGWVDRLAVADQFICRVFD